MLDGYDSRIVSDLRSGLDPFTGDVLDRGHLCQQPTVQRALGALLEQAARTDTANARPKRSGMRWTQEEVDNLVILAVQHTNAEIAIILDRSTESVAKKSRQVGIRR